MKRARITAVVLCFTYRALAGCALGLPFSLAAATVVGRHPRGDALLADSAWLLETSRVLTPSMETMTLYTLVVLVVAAFGWLLPLGALIASLDAEDRPWSVHLGLAATRLPALSLLLGATWLAQASIAVACVKLARFVGGSITSVRTADVVGLAGPVLALTFGWVLAVAHDAVRVPLLLERCSLPLALERAWPSLRSMRTWLAAGWRTLLALAVTLAAFAGGLWLWQRASLVVAIHLASLAVYIWLRASWLAVLARR